MNDSIEIQGTVNSRYKSRPTIEALIKQLSSTDGLTRVNSRRSLVDMGTPAVDYLEEALSSKNGQLRWEAAKALGQIGDPTAIQALIRALEDKRFDVRWVAAQGLIAIGECAIVPLLHALIERPESTWLREGVHHIFHDLLNDDVKFILRPVIKALEDLDPELKVPPTAKKALLNYNRKRIPSRI